MLVKPYSKRIGMLGLGTSVGGQLTAPLVVVRNFSQLSSASVSGKIVLFNYICDWSDADHCYGACATYRVDGASMAAKFGAVASLTRSLTGKSIYTPHTGVQHYDSAAPAQIPTACITTEGEENDGSLT